MYLWKVTVKTTNSTNDCYVDYGGGYQKCVDGVFYTACDNMVPIDSMVREGDIISVEYVGFYLAA